MTNPAHQARDTIWTFRQSPDAVTLLELMRSAELDQVPLTPRVGDVELALAGRPLRLVLSRFDDAAVSHLVVEAREVLDDQLTAEVALEMARQLRSSVLWRTVRLHVEAHTLKQQQTRDD